MDVLEGSEAGVQQRMELLISEMFQSGIRYDEAMAAFRKAFISVAFEKTMAI